MKKLFVFNFITLNYNLRENNHRHVCIIIKFELFTKNKLKSLLKFYKKFQWIN